MVSQTSEPCIYLYRTTNRLVNIFLNDLFIYFNMFPHPTEIILNVALMVILRSSTHENTVLYIPKL